MFRVGLAATLAVWLAGGAAHAAETDADWLKRPTAEQLFAVWPTEAWKQGLNGRAVISCKVSAQGAPFDCKVDGESPAGMGFGVAAIALTPQFLMKPATRDGKAVESDVRIPINFTGLSPQSTGSRLRGGQSSAPRARSVVADLVWDEAPAYSDVAAAYPEKARAAGLGGRATLKCSLMANGRLTACNVVSEEPKGQGFGAAARQLIPMFVGPTQFSDGKPIAGSLTQVPFVFAPEMLDPAKRFIGKPKWAALPTGDAMVAGYPTKALEAGVTKARVVIACTAGVGGKLESCTTVSESPADMGFADAGMALSKSFRIRPWTEDGLPIVGGTITVPIRYELPAEAPPPVAGGSAVP